MQAERTQLASSDVQSESFTASQGVNCDIHSDLVLISSDSVGSAIVTDIH
jgi:hypothetical protein